MVNRELRAYCECDGNHDRARLNVAAVERPPQETEDSWSVFASYLV